MRKLGQKHLIVELRGPIAAIPPAIAKHGLRLTDNGCKLVYDYDTRGERTGITALLDDLRSAGLNFKDLVTTESSLEDIFVSLLRSGQ